MIRITSVGNLGADPEVRYTQKGTKLVSFRVAVNSQRTNPDGEKRNHTDWFRVKVTGAKAEYAERFLKGNRVLFIGRLEIDEYQARDNTTRTGLDVWADELMNLSPRDDADGGNSYGGGQSRDADEPAAAAPNGRSQSRSRAPTGDAADLEDLPF